MISDNNNKQGKVIFLNGATSSGKTTIAKLLQSKIEEPFWHFSIDHLRDGGVLPLARIKNEEFPWSDQRDAFFSGFHHSLPAYLQAGNNLIVEHIIETQEWRSLLIELLRPYDVYFVGVQCPLEELERREIARGDRPVGGARKDHENIVLHTAYDLELDGTKSPEVNVDLLLASWRERKQPSVFFNEL